jgi:quercetin dioxygenase-like cupin family protein
MILLAVTFSAGWLMAQSPQPGPKAANALEFGDASRKQAPDVPSHHFASGEFGSVFVATPSKPIRAHFHATHDETVVMLRGKGRMALGSKEIEVAVGDVVFVPKGVVHDFRPSSDDSIAVSCFAPVFDGKDRIFVDKEN